MAVSQPIEPGGNTPYYWVRQGVSLQRVQELVQELVDQLASLDLGDLVGGGGATSEEFAALQAQVQTVLQTAQEAQAAANQAAAAANAAVTGKVTYPTGGSESALLVKSSTTAAWSPVTSADLVTSSTVDQISFSATAPTGPATNGTYVITPV